MSTRCNYGRQSTHQNSRKHAWNGLVRLLPAGFSTRGSIVCETSHENPKRHGPSEIGSQSRICPHVRITTTGNEYFTINFARFHCSNCEHFRPAGAKPQGATINYDGVMPQSIYYAAHRMSPQMIPTCLQNRALCHRPRAHLWGFLVWRLVRRLCDDVCRKPWCSRYHVCVGIRGCVHLDKLAALNLMSFISSNDDPWTYIRPVKCFTRVRNRIRSAYPGHRVPRFLRDSSC